MKCAIVGCGGIAKMHAEVIRSMKVHQFAAFVDIKPDRAIEYAKIYGDSNTHAYDNIEQMLESEKIDVLHICTPHYLHVPMALMGLQSGVNVMMEKPPAITREQFGMLENMNPTNNLGICFQNRYNQSVLAVKEMLESGETGKILGARAFVTWNRTKPYYTESGWRGTWDTEGGGALINQSIHTLDLLVHFIGKPVRTEAHMANHHLKGIIEVEDTLEAYMEFEAGPVLFYASTAYSANPATFIEIHCEHVVIRIEDADVTCFYPDGKKQSLSYYKGHTIGKDYWGTGHTACIKDFYECITTNQPYKNDLASVRDTFSLMMDIYESAKEQQVIEFVK